MAYIFPKRVLRDGDVLDPIELNEDTLPAAELYSGRINEHNITTSTTFIVSDDLHYKHHYVGVSAATGVTGPPTYLVPNVSHTANEFSVPNDQVWTTIDSMTRQFTSNDATLWISAHVQYMWGDHDGGWYLKASGTHGSLLGPILHLYASETDESAVAAIQFALRVDGRLIEWSVTGHRSPNFNTPEPYKPTVQKTSIGTGPEAYLPGAMLFSQDDAGAIGPPVLPVRLGAMYAVTPGSHTVELVVRRITERGPSHTVELADTNRIYVMNRQLYVMEIPTLPPAASTYDSVEIQALDSEDLLSEDALAARVDVVRSKFNLVQPGALSRGSIAARHVYSGDVTPLVDSDSTEFNTNTDSTYFSNYYPGFNTSTITTNRSLGAGWWLLEDMSSTALGQLKTDSFKITSSTNLSSTEACTFVILANVRVTYVKSTYPYSSHIDYFVDEGQFGSFCLGYKTSTSGTATIVGQTEVLVNNFNNMIDITTKLNVAESVDIALMHVLQFDSDPGYDIDYFAVYGSAFWSNPAEATHPTQNAKVYFRNASIQVLQFRGS